MVSTNIPCLSLHNKFLWGWFHNCFLLHKGNRLRGGRRNGNKSSERQRREDSWALICADTISECLSFIYALSGLCQRFTSLPSQWFPRGDSFFISLTQENGHSRRAEQASVHHLMSKFRQALLRNPFPPVPAPGAVWLMLSESFGT